MAQASSNKNEKSFSRQWYKNNPDVIEKVIFCMVYHLPLNESVAYMKEMGYPMDERTFRRIRQNILKKWEKRYYNILAEDFVPFTFRANEASKLIEYELWKIVRTSKTSWEKMKPLGMLRKTKDDQLDILNIPSAVNQIEKDLKKELGLPSKNEKYDKEFR